MNLELQRLPNTGLSYSPFSSSIFFFPASKSFSVRNIPADKYLASPGVQEGYSPGLL